MGRGRPQGSASKSCVRYQELIRGAGQQRQAGNQKQVTKETKVTAKEKEVDKTKFKTRPWVRGPQCQDDGEVSLGEVHLTLNFARIIAAAFLFSFFLF